MVRKEDDTVLLVRDLDKAPRLKREVHWPERQFDEAYTSLKVNKTHKEVLGHRSDNHFSYYIHCLLCSGKVLPLVMLIIVFLIKVTAILLPLYIMSGYKFFF